MKSRSVVNWHPASEEPESLRSIVLEVSDKYGAVECFAAFYFLEWTLIPAGRIGVSPDFPDNLTPIRWFYQSDLQEPKVQEPPDDYRDVMITTKKGHKKCAWYGVHADGLAVWHIYKNARPAPWDWKDKPIGWQPISWREVNDDD